MQRLWAPWRMTYIGDADREREEGCFFCNAWQDAGNERKHLLLARGAGCFVMMNRYPYSSAHLLVAPERHIGSIEETTGEEGGELWRLTTLAKEILGEALDPDGFNIGINQGRAAGAGVLDHLHLHVVPRWNGDVNFMPILADVRVIPQALEKTWEKLKPFFDDRVRA